MARMHLDARTSRNISIGDYLFRHATGGISISSVAIIERLGISRHAVMLKIADLSPRYAAAA